MGVKITGSSGPELWETGEYLLKVVKNEAVPSNGKIKIRFVAEGGQYHGKSISRNFNNNSSPMAELGKFLANVGVIPTPGVQMDLDCINGAMVYATVVPFQSQNGPINSIQNFRRAQGGVVPAASGAPVAAPAPQYAPAPAPQYAPAPAPQYAPAPAQVQAPAQAPVPQGGTPLKF